MAAKFTDCPAYIYDDGKLIATSIVTMHYTDNATLEIEYVPELADRAKYEVMIVTAPSPFVFSCITEVKKELITLKLFRGEKRELRKNHRYELSSKVQVVSYISDSKTYNLHTPLDATVLNLSKSGVRIKMKVNSMRLDDIIHLTVPMGANEKVLRAQVVNIKESDDSAEYGCRLILN